MKRYKVIQVEEKITLRGLLLVPANWEEKYNESEIGEHLDVDDHYEDRESEVWDEWDVEVADDAKVYSTVDFDFVKAHRVKEDAE